MKKFIVLLVSMLLMIPAASNAQNSNALSKALKKEYKSKMKEFKKDGWKNFGSTRSLEVVLLKHYEEMNEGKGEVVGLASVSDAKHKNLLKSTAEVNAFTTYARNSGMALRGRVVADLGLTDEEKSEFEHVYQAYEGSVEKEIKGELKPSFSVIRETSDNHIEMQIFYLVDEDAATKARIRAFENAAKESEIAQKYANKVSDFIREGFDNK